MRQLAIFDAAGAPIAPPHAAGARRERVSDDSVPSNRKIPTPAARRTDPATSKRAAVQAGTFAESHRGRILAALERPGTIKELAARTGIDHVAVARRMGELQRAEPPLAQPTGEVREGCRVWMRCA